MPRLRLPFNWLLVRCWEQSSRSSSLPMYMRLVNYIYCSRYSPSQLSLLLITLIRKNSGIAALSKLTVFLSTTRSIRTKLSNFSPGSCQKRKLAKRFWHFYTSFLCICLSIQQTFFGKRYPPWCLYTTEMVAIVQYQYCFHLFRQRTCSRMT